MSLEQRISEVLKSHPGLEGREIAEKLGLDKRAVNSCLNRFGAKLFIQDAGSYRWRLKDSGAGPSTKTAVPPSPPPQTVLSKLCRCYLDCISQESELDISVFATSRFGLDYVGLGSMAPMYSVFRAGSAKHVARLASDRCMTRQTSLETR